ncbi:MAG: aldose 1-epimerase [Gammaproteobacteria bacterium]|nr:aldose 1-epimerase [Gammaproteobacteria bacterium]
MNPQAPATVRLEQGSLQLELAPHAGGSIAAFRFQRGSQIINLMRPSSEQALQDGNAGATSCFPLVPFSNRIENGRFEHNGREIELPLNFAGHPHSLHGQGFQHPWQLIEHTSASAAIVYEHAGGDDGWPWVYRAEQRFTLNDETLIASISVQNNSLESMPTGLGFHPFFPKTAAVQLDIGLDQVWLGDEFCIPHTLTEIPEHWRFANHRTLEGIVLDHCFTGWDGEARIFWPEYKLGLNMTHKGLFKHMVIYVPEGQSFFCVEPVSHVNNAINLAAGGVENTGYFELAPNETAYAEVRYKLIT